MSDAPELRPCPFCGSVEQDFYEDEDARPGWHCRCGAMVTAYDDQGETEAEQREIATLVWNRRVSPGVRLSESQIAELRELAAKASPGPWKICEVPADESELRGCCDLDDMSGPDEKLAHLDLYYETLPVAVARNEPGMFQGTVDIQAEPVGHNVACIVGMKPEDADLIVAMRNLLDQLIQEEK